MKTDSLLNEIQEINLSYLLLAQRLLKEDYATALFRLKVDADMAELLMSLSARQLGRLAGINQLLFKLSLDDAAQLRRLTHNQREQGMAQTHAALLMASASCQPA